MVLRLNPSRPRAPRMVIHPLGSATPTRRPTRSPVAATFSAAGVGDSWRPSRPGLLRSPTSSELQPASVMTPRAAAARREVRVMAGILPPSEPEVDGEVEAPARRIRRDVDVPRARLVPEIADLRIEAMVRRRQPEEVPRTHRDLRRAHAAPQAPDGPRRQVPAHRHLPHLHERGRPDVGGGGAAGPRADARVARLAVGRVLVGVLQQAGQVDHVSTLLPVHQRVEAHGLPREVVAERHPELGVGVAHPEFRMSFSNDLTWKTVSLHALVDWQQGGNVINLTRLLQDANENAPDGKAGD